MHSSPVVRETDVEKYSSNFFRYSATGCIYLCCRKPFNQFTGTDFINMAAILAFSVRLPVYVRGYGGGRLETPSWPSRAGFLLSKWSRKHLGQVFLSSPSLCGVFSSACGKKCSANFAAVSRGARSLRRARRGVARLKRERRPFWSVRL